VVVWYLDLQLPIPSVPITTKVVSSNLAHDKVYSIQHYMIKSLSVTCLWFPSGTPVSSTNKTDRRQDIAEILLKLALNTITQPYSIQVHATGADPGFQVSGADLIAPSGGRRDNFWGISCEKSRFYAKKSYFFSNFRRGARPLVPPLCWNETIRQHAPTYSIMSITLNGG
jgi:hypothetical protein